jgi:hypothetical protein
MNPEPGLSADLIATERMIEAEATSHRPARGGVGVKLLLIAFGVVAVGVQGLWIAFLSWLVIRLIF